MDKCNTHNVWHIRKIAGLFNVDKILMKNTINKEIYFLFGKENPN